jgi:hypothetical protein
MLGASDFILLSNEVSNQACMFYVSLSLYQVRFTQLDFSFWFLLFVTGYGLNIRDSIPFNGMDF